MVNFARQQELKSGWKWVKFGDVVKLSTARCNDPLAQGIERYVGLEHIDSDDLRIQRWGLVEDGITFTSLFKPGQVLFGKRRAYLRKVAVPDFAGVCSGDIYVFESANPQVLLPELLPFICQTERFFEYAIGTSAGSLSPRTNWKSLVNFEFVLPSLKEQYRLLEILNLSENYRRDLQRLFENIISLEIAWLNTTFKNCKNIKFTIVSLRDILEKSPESGISVPAAATFTGHSILALNALTEVGYLPGQLKDVDKTASMMSVLLKKGDLLISRSNTLERVGFVGIYDGEKEGNLSFPDTMMRLVVKSSLVLPEYLEMYLQSPSARQQITSIAAGTSSSMKKINKANLQNLSIPVANLDTQIALVENRQQIVFGRLAIVERIQKTRNKCFILLNQAIFPNYK